jgi:hypothetical protein
LVLSLFHNEKFIAQLFVFVGGVVELGTLVLEYPQLGIGVTALLQAAKEL